MKPKFILKSLADIPVNALSLAASMPELGVIPGKEVPARAARLTPGQIPASRPHPAQFAGDLSMRAGAPFSTVTSWRRGGINE